MSVKKSVDLFYDVISPYAWIAFEVLCRYRTSGQWNMNLRLKPIFLGAIIKGSDNKPPAAVPNKRKYMIKDVDRLRDHMNVPLTVPANFQETIFVKGTLPAMRFITAVDMKVPEKTEDLSRELWMRIWARDEDITQPDSFREAGRKAGLSDAVIDDAQSRIKDQAVKDRLREYTEEALELGAFGTPIIIAHMESGPELFFGSDRFNILAKVLGETWKGPLPELNRAKL